MSNHAHGMCRNARGALGAIGYIFGMQRFSLPIVCSLVFLACASSEAVDETEDAELRETRCGALPTSWMRTWRIAADEGRLQLRVGEVRPAGTPVGDVLFLHGFSDRMDNHRPLFDAWTSRGFRVVSFEYPSHGETCGRNLVHYLYPSLARFAQQVEEATREEASRPLLVAGWSMGGLLAARMMQDLEGGFSRPVAGAMLLTPGVVVHAFLGKVQNATLTRNPSPPHTGPIAPTRPAIFPIAANILYHGDRAFRRPMPEGVPILTVVGGDEEDVYAKSEGVRSWVIERRMGGANMMGLSCPGGYHEIDNEPAPMGPIVQKELGNFATSVVNQSVYVAPTDSGAACHGF